jgi:hypothetical protein
MDWERLMPPLQPMTRMGRLGSLAHRLLRLVEKLLAQGVEYVERGPRQMDSIRLLARMIRLQREFRQHGFEIQFTPSPADPGAERDFRG